MQEKSSTEPNICAREIPFKERLPLLYHNWIWGVFAVFISQYKAKIYWIICRVHRVSLDNVRYYILLLYGVNMIPHNWLLYYLLVWAKGHEVQLQHFNIYLQILPTCNLQMSVLLSKLCKPFPKYLKPLERRKKNFKAQQKQLLNYLLKHKCFWCSH